MHPKAIYPLVFKYISLQKTCVVHLEWVWRLSWPKEPESNSTIVCQCVIRIQIES